MITGGILSKLQWHQNSNSFHSSLYRCHNYILFSLASNTIWKLQHLHNVTQISSFALLVLHCRWPWIEILILFWYKHIIVSYENCVSWCIFAWVRCFKLALFQTGDVQWTITCWNTASCISMHSNTIYNIKVEHPFSFNSGNCSLAIEKSGSALESCHI